MAVFNAIKPSRTARSRAAPTTSHGRERRRRDRQDQRGGRAVRRAGQEDPGSDRRRRDQGHPRHGQVAGRFQLGERRSTRSRATGHHEEVRPGRRQRPGRLRLAPGRGPRPARRERRRQVDADVDPVRALPPGRGRDPRQRRAGRRSTRPSNAIELGIGMVHQHFMLVPVMTVAENIVLGGEPRRRGGLLDVREGARRVQRAVRALRPGGRPRRADRGRDGRRPAARGDPQDALPRRAHPRARRADRGADRAGDGRAVRGAARAARRTGWRSCSSATSSARCSRSPTASPCCGAGKKIDTVSSAGRDRAEPGAPDGRPRRAAAGRQAGRRAPGARARGRRPARARRPRARGGSGRVADRARGRDRGPRGRRRQRPARAGRGDRRPAQARTPGEVGDRRRRTSPATACAATSDAGVAHIAEDRQLRGLVLDFTLAENLALREYRSPALSRHGWLNIGHINARAREAAEGVRRPRRRRRARWPPRSRAATSRRSHRPRDRLQPAAC